MMKAIRRADAGDVAEVLLRSDADVDAAAGASRLTLSAKSRLVRDEVLGEGERAGRFGERFDQSPEVAIAEGVRKRGAPAGAAGDGDDAQHDGERGDSSVSRLDGHGDILTSGGL